METETPTISSEAPDILAESAPPGLDSLEVESPQPGPEPLQVEPPAALNPLSDLGSLKDDEHSDETVYDDDVDEEMPLLLTMGVMDVDKKLGGGLPLATITLVEGDPESGKSVILDHLSYSALKEGLTVSAFLAESTPREFLDQMDSLGMSSTDYYLLGKLSLYSARFRVEQEEAEQLTSRLLKYLEKSAASDVILVDSVTPLLFHFDDRFVLSFLATCKELAGQGKTVIVTLHSYAINESLRLRANSIVDAHLRLRIEELGGQTVRTLEVMKIRGAVKTVGNSVSFTVEPGIGLKTVPISKTKA